MKNKNDFKSFNSENINEALDYIVDGIQLGSCDKKLRIKKLEDGMTIYYIKNDNDSKKHIKGKKPIDKNKTTKIKVNNKLNTKRNIKKTSKKRKTK